VDGCSALNDEQRTPPRISGVSQLGWGLAAAGFLIAPISLLIVHVIPHDQLNEPGRLVSLVEESSIPALPAPQLTLGSSGQLALRILAPTIGLVAPLILAVSIAVLRARWVWGPLLAMTLAVPVVCTAATVGFPRTGFVLMVFLLVGGLVG
jgi:hypothetical protein